jgi:hypothetical protein
MNELRPSYEPETGQLILEGQPAGPAGEAGLEPAKGVDLAFDRADGRLVQVVADLDGEPAVALLARLFGPQAACVLHGATARPAELAERPEPSRALSAEPGLCSALSSLARLDAVKATSPVSPSSPWWAAEAAVLADQAGLHARALTEARRAVCALARQVETLPGPAVRTALAAADIAASEDPESAHRLRENLAAAGTMAAGPRHEPDGPGLDVAAEVEGLEKDPVRLPGVSWMLDPGLVPAGLFRPGLSPHSDLFVWLEAARGQLVVAAELATGGDCTRLARCQARLVVPAPRRVLAKAAFDRTGSQVTAELALPFSLDELDQPWVEVVGDADRPVRSAKGHRIRRALRWADAALRAERAPVGLAPRSASADWVALASLAWDRCSRDWEAADDPGRAAAAAKPERRMPLPEPACLAEVLGS